MKRFNDYFCLFCVFIGGIGLNLWFAHIMPAVNDEAFYLYDGYNINHGLIPHADFTTKSTPFIYLLSLWQQILGYDFYRARILMLSVSLISGAVLYLLVREYHKKIALISVTLFLTSSFTASRGVLVMTNMPFVLCYLTTIYLLVKGIKERNVMFIVFSSLSMLISFFVRQTSIFIVPFAILIAMFYVYKDLSSKKLVKKYFSYIGIWLGLTALLGILVYLFTLSQLGGIKTQQVFGFNTGATVTRYYLQNQLSASFTQKIKTLVTPFIDMSLYSPLFFYSLFAGSLLMLKLTLRRRLPIFMVLAYFMLIFFRIAFVDRQLFLIRMHGSQLGVHQNILTAVFSIMIILFVSSVLLWWYRYKKIQESAVQNMLLIFSFASIALIAGVYYFYTKFENIAEISPGLSIISAVSLYSMWQTLKTHKQLAGLIFAAVILLSSYAFYYNSTYIGIGSHSTGELYNASSYIEKNSDKKDTVFTGFVLFALLADREVLLNISHPAWYGYTHMTTAYRDIFLPPVSEYERELKTSLPKFAAIDRFTEESYLKQYPRIKKLILTKYRRVKKYSTFELLVRK